MQYCLCFRFRCSSNRNKHIVYSRFIKSLFPRLKLTSEQVKALSIVERGHNVLVTGQAGTGKSHLVEAMYDRLRNGGKAVEVVCASGIAGNAYSGKFRTSTAHAFYGLRTADLPSDLVIERAVANNLRVVQYCRLDSSGIPLLSIGKPV